MGSVLVSKSSHGLHLRRGYYPFHWICTHVRGHSCYAICLRLLILVQPWPNQRRWAAVPAHNKGLRAFYGVGWILSLRM